MSVSKLEEVEAVITEVRRVAAGVDGEGNPIVINALIGSTNFREGSISV